MRRRRYLHPPAQRLVNGPEIHVGTAGWSVPRIAAERFPSHGTHLQRYAARLPAVEINTSFYRPHRRSTYQRWAASVPDHFRFCVKAPRAITHTARLRDAEAQLDEFLGSATALGEKLGCLLLQLPPSLAYDADVAESFFSALRARYDGAAVCEPRHRGWLEPEAEAMLARHRTARVAADPARPAGAGEPGGWPEVCYFRLHGSPRMYYSDYSAEHLAGLAARLRQALAEERTVWCVFDNTAEGAATRNALDLLEQLRLTPRVG